MRCALWQETVAYHHGRMKAAESRKKKNTVCPAVLEKQSTSDAGDYKMALCTFWHIFLTQSAMQWELGTRRLQVRHGKFVPIECQLQVPGKITDYNLISRRVTCLFCREFWRNCRLTAATTLESAFLFYSPRHHKFLRRPMLHRSVQSADKCTFLRKRVASFMF